MRRSERGRHLLLIAGLCLSASACTAIDNALASVPFFAFLRESPSFDPYEAPRPAPPGAVPFNSPAGDAPPRAEPTEAALNAFAAGPYGVNPLPPDSALELGREMYERHCSVCHGPQGGGDGTIIGQDKYPALAPNLTLPATVARADGYMYALIQVGRGLMPAYGPRTTHLERWAIVNYVRQLQQASGAAPAAAQPVPQAADTTGATPPDTTGDR